MKLVTPLTTRTQAFARPAIVDLYHPEGYWSLQTEGESYLDSYDQLKPGAVKCPPRANFNWESHTGITRGCMRIKTATVVTVPDHEGPILMVDGYLISARLATPNTLDYPPNFSTSNVWGAYADWADFLYQGSCTVQHEHITQDLLDHIHEIITTQANIDALKASFGK